MSFVGKIHVLPIWPQLIVGNSRWSIPPIPVMLWFDLWVCVCPCANPVESHFARIISGAFFHSFVVSLIVVSNHEKRLNHCVF